MDIFSSILNMIFWNERNTRGWFDDKIMCVCMCEHLYAKYHCVIRSNEIQIMKYSISFILKFILNCNEIWVSDLRTKKLCFLRIFWVSVKKKTLSRLNQKKKMKGMPYYRLLSSMVVTSPGHLHMKNTNPYHKIESYLRFVSLYFYRIVKSQI